MSFADAVALATEIQANRCDLVLIAIGRFVPPADIRDETPWAISVHTAEGGKMVIVRSEADLPPVAAEAEAAAGMLF